MAIFKILCFIKLEKNQRISILSLRRMNVLACCGSNELNEAEDGGSSANPNYLFLSPEKLHVASNPDPLNEVHFYLFKKSRN